MRKILLMIVMSTPIMAYAEEPMRYCGTYISKQHGIQNAMATIYGKTGTIEYKVNGETWYRSYNSELDEASLSSGRIQLWNDTDPRPLAQWEFSGEEVSKVSLLLDDCY
ncbi:hypothetical protein [Vibrio owensii]|uniref:hypothetical protein n=1 Tax=Vibrio owensii TaxID=696485 RepID=UPI003AAF0E31